MGIDTYQGGSPQITATVSGANEYTPGQAANITILVQNSGVNTDKFVMTGTIDRPDNPTTARMVMVGLYQPAMSRSSSDPIPRISGISRARPGSR